MTDPTDPLRNPRDPLHKSKLGLELFRAIGKIAHGQPADATISAACNLLINSVRQTQPDWARAEKTFDEAFGRAKELLKSHYDASGRKKGVFPFDQVISVPLFLDKDRFHRN